MSGTLPRELEMDGAGSSRGTSERLGRGRLILVLEALLTTRSVTKAARRLGLQPSGVSRTLGELRTLFDDPLLIRSGRGLVPSPKAEVLHPRLQEVAAAIHAMFESDPEDSAPAAPARERFDERWNVPYPVPVAALAVTPALPVPEPATPRRKADGAPPRTRARADAKAATTAAGPTQRLAQALGIIGTKGKGRGLEAGQAEEAMSIILAGAADPVQIGAFLSLVQIRGATASELAGFVRAARAVVRPRLKTAQPLAADLDWPSYISPRDQRPPWFFHAARLIAQAGHRVVLHGSSGPLSGRQGIIADTLGIPTCTSGDEVVQALAGPRIAYLPLAALSPQLFRLLDLYGLMNARSPVHELVHLLQPVKSRASLLGVAKPSYREIHRDAAMVLGEGQLSVIGNTKDMAQLNPFHATTIYRLTHGIARDEFVPSRPEPPALGRLPVTSLEHWRGVWAGTLRDPRAEEIIVSTAAAGLLTLDPSPEATFETARAEAERLWTLRHSLPDPPTAPSRRQ